MTTKKYIELINVKQKFLFSGSQESTKNIISALDDDILSSVDYKENEKLDDKAEFSVNVLINNDKQHLIFQVAFVYGYSENDKETKKYYSILGKFESLIKIQNEISDVNELGKFINENVLTMIEPIMNYISKSISEMTADTLSFPMGVDMYSRFEKMLKEKGNDLLK